MVYHRDRWVRSVVLVHWVTRWPREDWGQRALPTCSPAHCHGWTTAGGPSWNELSPLPTLKPGRRKKQRQHVMMEERHWLVVEPGIRQTVMNPLSTYRQDEDRKDTIVDPPPSTNPFPALCLRTIFHHKSIPHRDFFPKQRESETAQLSDW